jgi:hypothetical protein
VYIFNASTGTLIHTIDNPNAYGTPTADRFGESVAISGNRAIVGAYGEDELDNLSSGKAYLIGIPSNTLPREWILEYTIDNPNAFGTGQDDTFGQSVAIDGNYAIVGAQQEDDADFDGSGKAYIFDVTTGNLLHTLDNPNPYGVSAGDTFGNSVAISGNYAIVGAYQEDGPDGFTEGKAYIYNVTTGNLLHTLDNPNAFGDAAGDRFGISVAASGNYAIAGASWEDDESGSLLGKAYIFDVTDGSLVHTLDNPNPDGVDTDVFGVAVAIDGDYAIVGATGEAANEGKAYIFDVTDGSLVHTLDSVTGAFFGESVSISGDRAIVGSYNEDSESGKAYIFDVTDGSLVHTLTNPNAYDTSPGDRFGYSVSISGNYAIVGAYGETDANSTSYSGKAYIYNVTTGELVRTLDNPNAVGTSQLDYFGFSVAIDGDSVIVGAYAEDDDATITYSGKAYTYKLKQPL